MVRVAPNVGWRDVPIRRSAGRADRSARGGRPRRPRWRARRVAPRARRRSRQPAVPRRSAPGSPGASVVDGRMLEADGYAGEIGHLHVSGGRPALRLRGVRLPGDGRLGRRGGPQLPAHGRSAAQRARRWPSWPGTGIRPPCRRSPSRPPACRRRWPPTPRCSAPELVIIGGGLSGAADLIMAELDPGPGRPALLPPQAAAGHGHPRLGRRRAGRRTARLGPPDRRRDRMTRHAPLRLRCQHLVTHEHGVLDDAVLVDRATAEIIGTRRPVLLPPKRSRAGWCRASSTPTCTAGAARRTPPTIRPRLAGPGSSTASTARPARFASLVTTDLDTLAAQIATLRPLVAEGEFAGIHLEGPFLSEKRGAHDPALLRDPEPTSDHALARAAGGAVEMITVAPELPGGLASIEAMVAAGAIAAVGHTDADDATVAAALDAGATVVTHLFNAMRPIHHREPGPIPRLLSDDRCMVELIGDGFHLHPRGDRDGRRRRRTRSGRAGDRRDGGGRHARRRLPTSAPCGSRSGTRRPDWSNRTGVPARSPARPSPWRRPSR